jgi:hypothetical protein
MADDDIKIGGQTGQAGASTADTSTGTASAGGSSSTQQPQQKKTGVNTFNLEEAVMEQSNQMQQPPKQYIVPDQVREKFPDLESLIETTESMNKEEKDYWFQILPIMTDDQISRFREILVNEKKQLEKIDKEYSQELTKLNEKHMLEWKEFESKEKREAIRQAEAAHEQTEAEAEAELLARLAGI